MALFTKFTTLTTTDETEIVQIPTGYVAHVNALFIANSKVTSHNVDVTVSIYKGKDESGNYEDLLINVADESTVPAGEYILEDNFVFVLQPGEVMTAQASVAGKVRVAVTFDLLYTSALLNFRTPI